MSWNPQELDPEWPFDLTTTEFSLNGASTALLVIDMQVRDISIPQGSNMAEQYPYIASYWNRRLQEIVIPNTQNLLTHFRDQGQRIVYTRNGPWTTSAEQMTWRLRQKLGNVPTEMIRGQCDFNIIDSLKAGEDDVIIDKLTSGAFTASALDHVLRNMGIRNVVITGILTDMCVYGTARVAAELGYNTVICHDACALLTSRAHNEALLMHARTFGIVLGTEDIIEQLQ